MIIHPNFDPVALRIGVLTVHWYGLMYLAGFAAAGGLAYLRARPGMPPRAGFVPGEIMDLVFAIALGAILGGRLGYVLFYSPAFYFANPLAIIAVWDGGMSFHGGLLGAAAAICYYALKTKRAILDVSDFLAPLIAPGLGFGRLGNFINQELWGRAADVPWAVLFHTAPGGLPRHPSQLYEFALEGVALFIIIWLYSLRIRARGRVTGLFLLLYGVFRFAVEFFREPDAHLGLLTFGMSMGQILCLPMMAAGIYFLSRKVTSPGEKV